MARTHVRIFVPSATQMHFGAKSIQPFEAPPFPGYLFETPASLGCVYNLVKVIKGCNPNSTTRNPAGGSKAIAIVDAFDNPTAAVDLATFSSQFGLLGATFSVVYASGTKPATDPTGGWEIEESLDVQWAHAMAPDAKIYLVEATDNSFTNLFAAVAKAISLVEAAGGGEVSMSWGGGEFAGETAYDPSFLGTSTVFVASTGDSPGTEYPSVSPNVVAAGGTSISRSLVTGNFSKEVAWQDAGGGLSLYEARPTFQNAISTIVGSARGVPDLSFDASPTSAVWIYDSNAVLGTGWFTVGGTSVAAPSLAGILNAAGSFNASSQAQNTVMYGNSAILTDFRDVIYGNCGVYNNAFSVKGWDPCTGIGVDKGLVGK